MKKIGKLRQQRVRTLYYASNERQGVVISEDPNMRQEMVNIVIKNKQNVLLIDQPDIQKNVIAENLD